MGQYHLIANLDKHEFVNPNALGDGLKLLEFGFSAGGTMSALALLLALSNGEGGGDYFDDPQTYECHNPLVGSWAGDRIAIIGDYTNADHLARAGLTGEFPPFPARPEQHPYQIIQSTWRDRSAELRQCLAVAGVVFTRSPHGFIERVAGV